MTAMDLFVICELFKDTLVVFQLKFLQLSFEDQRLVSLVTHPDQYE